MASVVGYVVVVGGVIHPILSYSDEKLKLQIGIVSQIVNRVADFINT